MQGSHGKDSTEAAKEEWGAGLASHVTDFIHEGIKGELQLKTAKGERGAGLGLYVTGFMHLAQACLSM